MNEAQANAIRSAISNALDNLYHAELRKRMEPDWKSGEGETADELIARCQRHLDELKDGIKEN